MVAVAGTPAAAAARPTAVRFCPALGAGGGGAGSAWVSTSHLTTFTNGTNPAFAAGSATSTACGLQTGQGTTGGTTGAGGGDTSEYQHRGATPAAPAPSP